MNLVDFALVEALTDVDLALVEALTETKSDVDFVLVEAVTAEVDLVGLVLVCFSFLFWIVSFLFLLCLIMFVLSNQVIFCNANCYTVSLSFLFYGLVFGGDTNLPLHWIMN